MEVAPFEDIGGREAQGGRELEKLLGVRRLGAATRLEFGEISETLDQIDVEDMVGVPVVASRLEEDMARMAEAEDFWINRKDVAGLLVAHLEVDRPAMREEAILRSVLEHEAPKAILLMETDDLIEYAVIVGRRWPGVEVDLFARRNVAFVHPAVTGESGGVRMPAELELLLENRDAIRRFREECQ